MQCFQKDPNLRVSARKLLKHPWVVNSKRSDSVVQARPPNHDEAVKSVQKWNEALKSPSSGSSKKLQRHSMSPSQRRSFSAAPSKGVLALAGRQRPNTELFMSPESAGKIKPGQSLFNFKLTTKTMMITGMMISLLRSLLLVFFNYLRRKTG